MNPLHLTASNYRTFECLDVDLPTGCVAVAGENGAGKSSILNAIDVALFAEKGELAPLLTTGEDELEICLEFEHAGELYRVRRRYSAHGRGKTTLDLEKADGSVSAIVGMGECWRPLTRETAAATQEAIGELLGLSRATFRSSSFLAQGDGAAWTEATAGERKAVLAEILGLSKWDELLQLARAELRTAENEIAASVLQIGRLDELAAGRPAAEQALTVYRSKLATAGDELAVAERQLEKAVEAKAANAANVELVRSAEQALAAAALEHGRVGEELTAAVAAASKLDDLRIELGEVAADAAQVETLEERLAELRELDARAQDAVRAKTAALAHADELERDVARVESDRDRRCKEAIALEEKAAALRQPAAHVETCEVCQQDLGADARKTSADTYQERATAIETALYSEAPAHAAATVAAIAAREAAEAIAVPEVVDLAPVEQQLRAARTAVTRRAELTALIAGLEETAGRKVTLEQAHVDATARADSCSAEVARARAAAGDDQVLEHAVLTARAHVTAARSAVDEHTASATRTEALLEQIAAGERELAGLRVGVAGVQERVDVLKLAERAYGRDGIPALIVESAAIPQLELEANRILGELGGKTADCRVELRTQRALKTSDQLRETLDIVIVTPTGERVYETFSGGEKTRLNLALRIALARLLAHRRGAESRLLAIDEPEGLDQAGMQALAAVLQGVAGDFDRTYLVSHQSELATAFDQTIRVVKNGDRSRIDDSGELAA